MTIADLNRRGRKRLDEDGLRGRRAPPRVAGVRLQRPL